MKKYVIQQDGKKYIKIKNQFIDIPIANNELKYVKIAFEHMIDFNEFLIKKKISAIMDAYICNVLQYDNIELLEYYIENSEKEYDEVLSYAWEYNNLITIKFLLEGASYYGIYNILRFNCLKLDISVIELFLQELKKDKNNFDCYISDKYLIFKIIRNNDMMVIKLFKKYGFNFFYNGCDSYNINDLLVEAVINNLIDMATYLLEQDADPDELDFDHLRTCCRSNYMEACDFMLENVSYTEKMINSIFIGEGTYIGVERSNPEIVQLLIDNGADVKKYGEQLRKKAKKVKNYHLVKYLDEIIKKS